MEQMINPVADANIRKSLYGRAVQFGNIGRENELKKWPYWLPFIPEPPPDDNLAPFPMTQALTGLGWPVAPGSFRDIPIETPQDAHFNLVNVKFTAYRGPLTGAITIPANNTAVAGALTLFDTELVVGDRIAVIDDLGVPRFGIVSALGAGPLAMTLEASFPTAVTGAAATGLPCGYRAANQWYEMLPHLNGGIEIAAGTNTVNGNGTAFLTELNVGQNLCWIDDAGAVQYGIIAGIANNTTLTLVANTPATSTTGTPATDYRHYMLAPLPGHGHSAIFPRQCRPLTTYLKWSMHITSTKDLFTVGGNDTLSGAAVFSPPSIAAAGQAGGLLQRPVNVRSMQTSHDGLGMLCVPYQVPRQGSLFIRVHNIHSIYTLYVNGAVFGYKVAI